jgi:hypothetical protein
MIPADYTKRNPGIEDFAVIAYIEKIDAVFMVSSCLLTQTLLSSTKPVFLNYNYSRAVERERETSR